MDAEEITLSEEMALPSWKVWIKENKIFIIVIGFLMLISFSLIIQNFIAQNFIASKKSTEPIQKPVLSLPLKERLAKPKSLKKLSIFKKYSHPLQKAQALFDASQINEAIQHLLEISQTHKEIDVRKKASSLLKEYRLIQEKREEIKKVYLQGYVLFQSYPQKACSRWTWVIKSNEFNDPYYQKAQKRFEENCLTY